MPETKRIERARATYEAYVSDDRDLIEGLLADDFVFYSPLDRASTGRRTSSAAGRTTS